MRLRFVFTFLAALCAFGARHASAGELADSRFSLEFGPEGLTALRRTNDVHDTNYVRPDGALGRLIVRWRAANDGAWRDLPAPRLTSDAAPASGSLQYAARADGGPAVSETFRLENDALVQRVVVRNPTAAALEIGDLAIPFQFNDRGRFRREDIYTKRLIRHSRIAGDGSWVFWQRSNGVGPYLVMTAAPGTRLEYFDDSGSGFTAYAHAEAAFARARAERDTSWRQPVTSRTLAPDASAEIVLRWQWAADFAAVRELLVEERLFDVHVAPGMTVSTDLPAYVAIRTRNEIAMLEAEFPDATRIALDAERGGASIWRIDFTRLGENLVTVRCADGRSMPLEFFVVEPLETVVKKRAAFLASRQQHKDPAKWYVGVFSDWDMKNAVLRSPEDRDGLQAWLTDACDDAGNARPAFLAAKNVHWPEPDEIAALELYVERYLWGGMQMTEDEPYPYALYGIPNWKVNRESEDPGARGRTHVWRLYDYPHIVLLYHRMYLLAKFHPAMSNLLDAETYLDRAYGTALAFYTVPPQTGWSLGDVPTMNEMVIAQLVESLEAEGRHEQAEDLRLRWEEKVVRYVNDPPNLYGSEFAFDSTGFETTGAFAKYALRRALDAGDPRLATLPPGAFQRRVSREAARAFQALQMRLNMSARGWLETSYWQLGSDYRGGGDLSYTLSYMSQMGGWSILDVALHHADDPTDALRLGCASALSAWALVNSGTPESDYGYWYPGPENDGAAGGGFEPMAVGRPWIRKEQGRGSWYYSSEADVGFCAGLRTASTILTRDPLFGEFAFGGVAVRRADAVEVVPRDALRVRLHVVRDGERLHVELARDGFAKDRPILVGDGLARLRMTIENRGAAATHETPLRLEGLPAGRYAATLDGEAFATLTVGGATNDAGEPADPVEADAAARTLRIPMPAGAAARTLDIVRQ